MVPNAKHLLLISLLALPSALHAQRVLTWEDTVAIAREKNPTLREAERSVESSAAGYKESFNGILPSVDLSESYSRVDGDDAESNRWSANLGVSLDLFNMSRYADISISRANLSSQEANYRLISASVLLNLRRAFASLLFAQNQVEVSKTIYTIRKKNASLVSLRYDSGRESKGNKLRSQAELLESEASVNQSLRDHTAAQYEFNRQLGEESFEASLASGTLSAFSSPSQTQPLDRFMDGHPLILRNAAELRSAEAQLRDARSVLLPTLSASYDRSVDGPSHFPDLDYDWSYGARLSLPIFGNGLTSPYYSMVEAKRNREGAEENLRAARYQVRSELESTLADFAGAVEQVGVQRAFLNAARQRNQEADIRYSNGLMSYEDWERIVTERVNFERSVIQAEQQSVFAEATWDNARGKGLGE